MSDRLNVTHDRFGTPHRAIVATGAVTALLIVTGLEVEAIVAVLAEVASFSFLVAYSLVHVALVVFRRADPDEYDPDFRIPDPLYPAVPVLGVVLAVVVLSQMALSIVALGLGIVALGMGWSVVYASDTVLESDLLREAIGRRPADTYTVVVPVANPATQRGLIRLAAASAKAHDDEATPELLAVNVLRVADRSPNQNVEAERLDHQHELLDTAHEIAREMDVSLRTRATTGEHVDDRILEVLVEEEADHVLLGWTGELTRQGYLFGPNLDSVVERAPCDVSLVTLREEGVGRPVALAGDGPHAPVAARRAAEFATVDDAVPTLVNVQPPGGNATERGERVLADVAERAGLDADEYDATVVESEDVEAALLEAVRDYDTVCVGLSERSDATRITDGTVGERISKEGSQNVGIVRGPYDEGDLDDSGNK